MLANLRQQAIAQSKQGGGAPSAAPKASVAERRKSTIAFFLEQKAGEFEEVEADISTREKALQQERRELQGRVTDEIADFLGLMSGGVETPEARDILHHQRAFLTQLGISEVDLLKRATTRR